MKDSKAPLPFGRLRFSKRMVALGSLLIVAGVGILTSPWSYSRLVGGACAGVGLSLVLTALYYWGCDNESCS